MNKHVVPDIDYISKYGDPRVEKYPLMKDPTATFFLIAVYVLFVYVVGPYWMKNKPVYEFRNFMVAYNLFTSALNAWIFYHFAKRWLTKYRLRGEPIDFSNNQDALKVVQVCWVYFMSKFMEFADTTFTVLRKKNSSITKLHVFHHSLAPALMWYLIKFGPGGYNTCLMMLNSFVHIWMYIFYSLAAAGPTMRKYLWWKKYVTVLQLTQFFILVFFWTQLYFFPPEYCKASTFLFTINMSIGVGFFLLFSNFYRTTYQKGKDV